MLHGLRLPGETPGEGAKVPHPLRSKGWGMEAKVCRCGQEFQGERMTAALLDMLPISPNPLPGQDQVWDIVDSVLEVGSTFSYNGLYLTPTKLDGASLTVCVEFGDHLDADSDGFPDACDVCPGFSDAQPCPIPTVSAWGLEILTLSILIAGTLVDARRHPPGLCST